MKDGRCTAGSGAAGWQAGRSAWLEGRVLALFRLGEHVMPRTGGPWPASRCWGVAWWGDAGGEPVVASPCTSSATPRWTVAVWTILPERRLLAGAAGGELRSGCGWGEWPSIDIQGITGLAW